MRLPGYIRLRNATRLVTDELRARRRDTDPLRTWRKWLRRPGNLDGRDVCVLMSWGRDPLVSEHALILARGWAAAGFAVVLVVARDDPATFDIEQDLSFCEAVLLRANSGYDFGAWAAAIRDLPELTNVGLLAIANDSVLGPLNGFVTMINEVRRHPAALVGAVRSLEQGSHLQSFMLFFKPAALRHPAFTRFWRTVRDGDRDWAIRRYELRLERWFACSGITTAALFPRAEGAPPLTNPTLVNWRALLADGFPFIKLQLLRDVPDGVDINGWEAALTRAGYDPAVAHRYLSVNPRRIAIAQP